MENSSWCFAACSSEAYINAAVKSNVRRHYSCHELFGFDILLDDNLKPWILEVNISPRWSFLVLPYFLCESSTDENYIVILCS